MKLSEDGYLAFAQSVRVSLATARKLLEETRTAMEGLGGDPVDVARSKVLREAVRLKKKREEGARGGASGAGSETSGGGANAGGGP